MVVTLPSMMRSQKAKSSCKHMLLATYKHKKGTHPKTVRPLLYFISYFGNLFVYLNLYFTYG